MLPGLCLVVYWPKSTSKASGSCCFAKVYELFSNAHLSIVTQHKPLDKSLPQKWITMLVAFTSVTKKKIPHHLFKHFKVEIGQSYTKQRAIWIKHSRKDLKPSWMMYFQEKHTWCWEDTVKTVSLATGCGESGRVMVTDDCKAIIYTMLLTRHYIIKTPTAMCHIYMTPIHC